MYGNTKDVLLAARLDKQSSEFPVGGFPAYPAASRSANEEWSPRQGRQRDLIASIETTCPVGHARIRFGSALAQ